MSFIKKAIFLNEVLPRLNMAMTFKMMWAGYLIRLKSVLPNSCDIEASGMAVGLGTKKE
jgi:hypothetical protein